MRMIRLAGVAALMLPGLAALGCGESDPVAAAASKQQVTVAPEATQGSEGAAKAQLDFEKRQQDADKAAKSARKK